MTCIHEAEKIIIERNKERKYTRKTTIVINQNVDNPYIKAIQS